MPKFDDDVLSGMTDEEREALEGEDDKPADQVRAEADNAQQRMAAADDDAADDTDASAPAADAATPPAAADAATPPAAAAQPDANAEAEAASALTPPFTPRLEVPDMSTYDADRAKLLDERRDLKQRWHAGDVANEDYESQLDAVNERLNALDAQKNKADSAAEFNEQMEKAQYLWTLNQTVRNIKAAGGIDYDDPANRPLRVAWDFEVKRLASQKENFDKPYEWFLEEANKTIEATTGRQRTPREQAPPPRPRDPVGDAVRSRQPDVSRVKSLAGLPNAAGDAGGQDSEFAHLDRLAADPSKGEEFETALARLSKDQQERYLSA